MSEDRCDVVANWPFVQIPTALLLDERLSDETVRTYGVLVTWARSKGECWPPTVDIAKRRGVGKSTLLRHLAILEDAEWILRERDGEKRTIRLMWGLTSGTGSHLRPKRVPHLRLRPYIEKKKDKKVGPPLFSKKDADFQKRWEEHRDFLRGHGREVGSKATTHSRLTAYASYMGWTREEVLTRWDRYLALWKAKPEGERRYIKQPQNMANRAAKRGGECLHDDNLPEPVEDWMARDAHLFE